MKNKNGDTNEYNSLNILEALDAEQSLLKAPVPLRALVDIMMSLETNA